MGDAKAEVAEVDFGVGVGAFAVGEGIGDGNGVATVLGPAFEANVLGVRVLPATFEFAALPADFDRSAEFLFAIEAEALR